VSALSPVALAFVDGLAPGRPRPPLVIHPGDEMYRYGLDSLRGSHDAAAILYFEKGWQIADAFAAALGWRFESRAPASVLDFAAGFGRSSRFLPGLLPAAEIWMSEIDPEAVAFQEEVFGIRGIVSSSDPATFRAPRLFDAVLAASFFSHVPAERFEAWLSALWRSLAPGGLLFFSTHGPDLLKEPADWSQGIMFRAESETRRLDPAVYGTAWVTRDYVTRKVAGATGGESRIAFIPFGLCSQQDVILVAKPPGVPRAPADLRCFPRGGLDRFDVAADAMEAEGWIETEGEGEVSFFVGNVVSARQKPAGEGSLRRWRFRVDRTGIDADDVLRVAATAGGLTNTLAMGTLRGVGVAK
jgi:SAM-dependent methyltransferase